MSLRNEAGNLQNALMKTGSEIGAVTASDWNAVSNYVISALVPTGRSAPLLPKEALMANYRAAVNRLLVIADVSGYGRMPTWADIEKSKKDHVFLQSQVGIFNKNKAKALGGARAAQVTDSQQELKSKVAAVLKEDAFKDPATAAWRGFVDELESQASLFGNLGKYILIGGVVIGGAYLAGKVL